MLKVAYGDVLFKDYELLCMTEVYLNLNIEIENFNIDKLCSKYMNLSWFCMTRSS